MSENAKALVESLAGADFGDVLGAVGTVTQGEDS